MGSAQGALMDRADLLALTPDDLAMLTNRGAVKRAVRELAAGVPAVRIHEGEDGTVTADAGDGTAVTLPAGRPLEHARCTCDAAGMCRHVVRAVLAYAGGGAEPLTRELTQQAVWDPGSFTDEELAASLAPDALRRGSRIAAAGVTATLVRSTKPMALLHEASVTVRFLVRGELSYARCECAGQPPCEHVVPAVRAFRALDRAHEGGVVETRPRPCPGTAPLAALDSALSLLAEAGVAGGGDAPRQALRRAEHACRAAGVTWPADVCAELADLCDRHARGDASFDPLRVAQLAGEALLRADALRAATGAVPALFAGGPPSSSGTAVGGGRLVGLGTRVVQFRRAVDVDALVYDVAAHRVLALGRSFGDPNKGEPQPPFGELAATSLTRRISIASVGAGQLIATGGVRTPSDRLRLGRSPAALSPQSYDWEALLRAPVLVAGAAEARAVRTAAVPSSLGPRTSGANLVVIPVGAVAEAGFHVATQSVVALASDRDGAQLLIAHPFSQRAAGGADRLLAALGEAREGSATLRFVSGYVSVQGAVPVLAPIGVVVEATDGQRRLVQPWVDTGPPSPAEGFDSAPAQAIAPGQPDVREHLLELQAELGNLLVTGIARADRTVRDAWARLAEQIDSQGSVILAAGAERVAATLAARTDDPRWAPGAAVSAALDLAPAVELARAL